MAHEELGPTGLAALEALASDEGPWAESVMEAIEKARIGRLQFATS